MNTIERKQSRREKIISMYTSVPEPNQPIIGRYSFISRIGLLTGFTMALYIAMLSFFEGSIFTGATYFQVLIMGAFLWFALYKNEEDRTHGRFFQNGMITGAVASIIVALSATFFNLLFAYFLPEMAIGNHSSETSSILTLLVAEFGMVIELFVFGMIITLIILQYLKISSSSRPINK